MQEDVLKKGTLNYDDNVSLIALAQKGSKEAMEKLMEINLPLVSALSKKFLNRGYDYEDIYQLGSIGLVKAIKNFDCSYNVKFSTYAVPLIVGEIKRFLRDDGIIKVSRTVKTVARQVAYSKEVLSKELNRVPTIEEISAYTGISKDDIIVATESVYGMQYLYDTIHQADGAPVLLIDKISETSVEDERLIDKISLKEALRSLDEKSRQIILLRYFKDKTQTQVANMLGISQVQVSRIEKKVLSKMKDMLREYE